MLIKYTYQTMNTKSVKESEEKCDTSASLTKIEF